MSTMPTQEFPFYSTSEAAVAIGVTEGRIRQLILANEIRANPVGRRAYAIPADEVERLKKVEHTTGRPRSSPPQE